MIRQGLAERDAICLVSYESCTNVQFCLNMIIWKVVSVYSNCFISKLNI